MGEKEGGDQKKGDGGKKEDGPITVVLKVDMHCEGCAKKVKRAVKGFDGVQEVKGDSSNNKLTVVGKVDPEKIRERIEYKTKKNVVLVSPLPNKDKEGGGGGGEKKKEKPDEKEKKLDDKKPKEPVVSTIVLKIRLHCEGCIHKIKRIISKTKGVEHVAVDPQKDLVTVKGTMDAKTLLEYLKEKLKRGVEIVQPKKDDGGGDKKGKGGGGGGGEKKDKEGGGGGEKKDGDKKGGEEKKEEAGKVEANKYEYFGGYAQYSGYGYSIENAHAPQIFSDENPNACSIM
ncbi:heavy metal-associated isoprenylated plant protein 3 isoform X1 [Cinnamomum micranthum f. kanehirae]|uniref:Heavy metal-associated isoprenylated plant protein 3 isoform X1 n=1 Tax=Cinnamomum micranthum f. kanehirae TaxID=337451 RepID=A0A443PLD4_9MAGN|nr:heavy metal-associated isoprenylated plant protein 3 isoform X1 [Cinnamomum micranthum f. kanehirae]